MPTYKRVSWWREPICWRSYFAVIKVIAPSWRCDATKTLESSLISVSWRSLYHQLMMCIFKIDFVLLKYQPNYMWSKSVIWSLILDCECSLSNIWESPRWLHFIIASKQWISFQYSLYFILGKKKIRSRHIHFQICWVSNYGNTFTLSTVDTVLCLWLWFM